MRILATVFLSTLWGTAALSEETRQLEAHEHGVGALNIAIEGKSVAMELKAPGADIVGFEYAATSAEDRASIDQALAQLSAPLELFTLPAAAECVATETNAALEQEEMAETDHDHAHDHDHDHGEKSDAKAEASHTEFHANYMLTCDKPEAITNITFPYFDLFPNARELEVQLISDQGAGAFEVERANPQLGLGGLI